MPLQRIRAVSASGVFTVKATIPMVVLPSPMKAARPSCSLDWTLMDGALLSGALLVPAVDIHMKTRRGRIARQHIHAVQEYRPDSLRRDMYIYISSFSSRLSRQIVLFVIPDPGALFSSTTTMQTDSVVVSLLMAETSRECRGARIGQR